MEKIYCNLHNLLIVDFNSFFIKNIFPLLKRDLLEYELINKENSKEYKRMIEYHIMFNTCKYVLNNPSKVVFFFNVSENNQFNMLPCIKRMVKHLNISFYFDNISFLEFKKNTIEEIVFKTRKIFSKNKQPINLSKIKKITKKSGLSYLSDVFLDEQSTKLLCLNKY